MRWIITTDRANDGNSLGFGQFDDGSHHYQNESRIPATLATMPTEFRLLDDDRNVHFEGRTRDIDKSERRAFAPFDWATNDGCTIMQHRPAGTNAGWNDLLQRAGETTRPLNSEERR